MGGLVRAGDVFAGHRVVEYPLGDWVTAGRQPSGGIGATRYSR